MTDPDGAANTTHPRSDEVRGRERNQGGYEESGGFGDRGYGDRGDFGDQGAGPGQEQREAGHDDGTPEGDAAPED
jgi:hypothetical protein